MSTFTQDPATGDLALTSGRLTVTTDPALAAAMILANKFRLRGPGNVSDGEERPGEWFLDTRIGVPYYKYILGVKNPDLGLIRRLFTKVILSTPPITSIESMSLSLDRKARTLNFSFRAKTDSGATITGGTGAPFIVEP